MWTILTSKVQKALWPRGASSRPFHIGREALLLIALAVLCAVFASQSEFFLSERNLTTVLRNSVDLSVVCAGMTIVIILGGIDVSVGGVLAVSAVLIGRAYQLGMPDWVVVPIGLAAGAALGALNGTIIARTRVPPIVATLGTMYIFIAVLFLVIGGVWISGLPASLSFLVLGEFLGLPAGLYVIGVIYALSWYLLRRTPWGQHVVAIGCDEGAARLVGIRVDRTKIQAYALLGLFAGLAAVLYVARLRNVEVNIGTNIALEAIAATILGGANIRGGTGSLLGALMGVLFIKITQNGLVLIGVSSLWETVVIGGLLIVVLVLDAFETRRVS
ncbi:MULTISPECIES: ABC transporter permease [Limimaricola]|uniref:ABC transporter permease n=1 Tax=Limimaricola litoreus TaxID=2955316 RepID=A0A9X2JMK8_9RHOB|nr:MULTISPECIES: ABC transporter permease [Limimaricola]MCP1167127.1 ABC transporter permease [Limimaricola litoreus]